MSLQNLLQLTVNIRIKDANNFRGSHVNAAIYRKTLLYCRASPIDRESLSDDFATVVEGLMRHVALVVICL